LFIGSLTTVVLFFVYIDERANHVRSVVNECAYLVFQGSSI